MDANAHVPQEEGRILYQWGKQLTNKTTNSSSKEQEGMNFLEENCAGKQHIVCKQVWKHLQTKGFPRFQILQTIEVHFEVDIMVQTKLYYLQCPIKATIG